ncbi:GvpL/GvpF family gas vesicle protein [Chlorobium phaeovibrioides]|uniref:GvpL/GvpF family gas vesicle protein n=1 Tax=Chlorobium phaeovibrioides TaxID=1094 RepID=UPI001F3570E0|nr:GvpL/GvpF family gas vesicle protein [Chlorobium phaeovibrioides]
MGGIDGIGESLGAGEADKDKDAVLDALSPIAEEVKVNDSYGSMMVLNAAFLIRTAREEEFDRAVNALDDRYHDMMTFKYVGTLPPYNFVNISINIKGR